jgi:hypothetical protein
VPAPKRNFSALLTDAIDYFVNNGFDSEQTLVEWLKKLGDSARASLAPESLLVRSLSKSLTDAYKRNTRPQALLKVHPGVSLYTLERLKPQLRAELDRRILASASLIKLNRKASIERTLQRFAGWATSVPKGGTVITNKRETRTEIRRGIAGLPFEERRVIVDQGHKLSAAVSDIVAVDGGAIIATWEHSNEGGGYQARPEHEARDGKVFIIRGSWADKNGYLKGAPYSDTVEQPAELPFCRCHWLYGYTLRDVPASMLTAKGKEHLMEARAKLRAVS